MVSMTLLALIRDYISYKHDYIKLYEMFSNLTNSKNGDEESRTPVQIFRHLQLYANSLFFTLASS